MALNELWEVFMLALAVWREARNQNHDAQVGVACSIRNRVQHPAWWGNSYVSVVLQPRQYTAFTFGDPNAEKFPEAGDAIFPACLAIARDVAAGSIADNTQGAQSYYDRSLDAHPPAWAAKMEHTCNLGDFRFYRCA